MMRKLYTVACCRIRTPVIHWRLTNVLTGSKEVETSVIIHGNYSTQTVENESVSSAANV